MKMRELPQIGKEISLLGFGLMRLPKKGEDSQDIDYVAAEAMLDRAMKAGVNYYDTAYRYHGGDSELFAGQTLSNYPRDSYYLATKMPTWALAQSAQDVQRIFEDQLARCRVDYFDFYLLHSLAAENMDRMRALQMIPFLQKMKEQGRIRHLGFSFHDTPALLSELVREHSWDFAQIQLNYIDWAALDARGQYEVLEKAGIPVIVMEPLRGGALAQLPPPAEALLKAARPTSSIASWGLRYAASLPGVMTVLSGMSTMEQVEDNLETFDSFEELSPSERDTLAQVVTLFNSAGTIPCSGCRYCMDCPSGVDIPRVFSIYNHYLATKNPIGFRNAYRTLEAQQRPDQCVACGQCLPKCPQHLSIPDHMKEIAAFAESQRQ